MDSQQIIFWCGVALSCAVMMQFGFALLRSVVRSYLEWKIYRARWQVVARELSPNAINPTTASAESANSPRTRSVPLPADANGVWTGLRPFRVAKKIAESSDCVSLTLVPTDGERLPPYLPGQYVTVSIRIPGETRPLVRCYSLSDAPADDHYRVTVKRATPPSNEPAAPAGKMSGHIHDTLQAGDIIELRPPQGTFCIDPKLPQDLVLIAGGVGITPMVAMLNALRQHQPNQPVYLFYVVRNGASHPFKTHFRQLIAEWPQLKMYVFYTQPRADEKSGIDFSRAGRLRVPHLQRVLADVARPHFYICGPAPLMAEMTSGLRLAGVPDAHIHTEAFGAVTRKTEMAMAGAPRTGTSEAFVPSVKANVHFSHSGKSVAWSSTYANLLELAEAAGVPIDAGCRAGHCGTCLTAIRAGQVTYPVDVVPPEPGKCYPCLAVPEGDLELDA